MKKSVSCAAVLTVLFLYPGMGFADGISSLLPQTGKIQGLVIDEELKSPISYAQVKIQGIALEAITTDNGQFFIQDIPVGNYNLEVACPLYIGLIKPDVIIKSGRITFVTIELKLAMETQEHEEVTVTATYFSEAKEAPTSVTNFSNEEIRRAAGSAGDVSRIVSGLPSIARVDDQKNSLIVRGGNPVENAFFVNNIEIPNINHYPNQGSSGGALALLNVDFIQEVNFYSGGFSSIYGNRLSSVMDISFREGNRIEPDFQLDLCNAGFGLIAEGPLSKEKGAWLFSARKSYIDLISEIFDVGVVPQYGDVQGKLTWDLSPQNKLTFLGIWGTDKSGWGRDKSLELGDPNYGNHDTSESVLGLDWFFMWGQNGYSRTSISRSHIKYNIAFYDTSDENLIFRNDTSEESYSLRNVNYLRLHDAHRMNFGFEAKYFSIHFDYALGEGIDVIGNPYPEVLMDVKESAFKYAAFFNYTWMPWSQLSLNLGLRADYLTYNKNHNLSPRFSFAFNFSPKTTLNGAAGLFCQNIPSILLLQNPAFKTLQDQMAYHYVLGFSHLLTQNTRLSIEVYNKQYRNMPLDPVQAPLFILDEMYYGGYYSFHETLVDTGKANAYGIEMMVQKKLAEKLYGVISASYFRTFYEDTMGVKRNRVYDNKYIVSVEGGYKLNKYWEFSLRWHFAGGTPYTPFDLEASQEVNKGIFDQTRINQDRLPNYHTMNIRADKRFYFGSSNLIIYFSIWNVYNRKNVAYYYWNTLENFPDVEYQWSLLPILGIEFEF